MRSQRLFESSSMVTLTRPLLIDALASGEAESAAWRVGTEYETFVYDPVTGGRLPYEQGGRAGVRELLEAVAEQDGWELDRADGRPRALR